MLVDPSRTRHLQGKYANSKLSYNELISVPNYTPITPLEFGVLQTFLPVLVGADVKTAFRSISFSPATSLQNLTVFYEGLDGQPLMTPEGAKRDELGNPILAIYAFKQMLFGQTDSPAVLGICLQQCVRVWKENAAPNVPIPEYFLGAVDNILSEPYVDDLNVGQPLWRYIEYAIRRCTQCSWCDECVRTTLRRPENKHPN